MVASFAISSGSAVDRRYEGTRGYAPTEQAVQARRLAQRFLARSRTTRRAAQAFGGSTSKAEAGTGGAGVGWFGAGDTPQQVSAPVVTALRRRQQEEYDSKSDFITSRAETQLARPRSPRKDYYTELRAPMS